MDWLAEALFGFMNLAHFETESERIEGEIIADFIATKKAMNDVAGQSYRNLVL